jgi:tetratricopeptide (TPR) repeat protein
MVTLGTMITNGGWVTEKGMGLAGVSLELDMNALELAEILNPCYYYIPYCRADILAYQGQYREALEILDRLLARDPNEEPRIPENRYFLKFAKTLRDDIERKQAEKGFFLTRWLRR